MHGVTTALVLFLFVCVVFPNLVKNRTQYYAALVAVCGVIFLDAIGMAVSSGVSTAKFSVFAYVMGALLQISAIVLLFLAAGGITWRQLANDMLDAYDAMKRGDKRPRSLVIPISKKPAASATPTPPTEQPFVETPPPAQEPPVNPPSQP